MADEEIKKEDEGEVSLTVFYDALKVKAEDGKLSIKDYNEAVEIARTTGDRRSHSTWGEIKRQWRESKVDLIASFFKGVKGLITAIFTAMAAGTAAYFAGVFDKLGG